MHGEQAKHCVPIPPSREYTLTRKSHTNTCMCLCVWLQECLCAGSRSLLFHLPTAVSPPTHSFVMGPCCWVICSFSLNTSISQYHLGCTSFWRDAWRWCCLFHSHDTVALWSFLHHYKWCFGKKNPWACIYLQFFILQQHLVFE